MSGHGYEGYCPNCNANTSAYTDHKPFDYVSSQCLECGWWSSTESGFLTLDELNVVREEEEDDDEFSPLEVLPYQDNEWISSTIVRLNTLEREVLLLQKRED